MVKAKAYFLETRRSILTSLELRKVLQDAENFLFNRKAELTFAVDKLTYGEHPKLVYKGSEIEVHSLFGMLVPEAPGHLYTERV